MESEKNYDELMYQKLHNSDLYKKTFKHLSQIEKDKYFIFLRSFTDVGVYVRKKDDSFILNYIKNNGYLLNRVSDIVKFELLEELKDKMLLLTVLEYLPKDFISSYRFRHYYIGALETEEQKMQFIDKIIEKRLGDISFFITLLNDENKIKYFKYMQLSTQVDLIMTMTNLELKKEYALKQEYKGFRSQLIASIEDEDFIIEMFDKINDQKFRNNLISRIKNQTLKEKLLKRLGYKTLTNFLDSFESEENEIIELDHDVDSKITIGVELETCHKDIEVLKILRDIPHNFKIHKDSSVKRGFEVVSPILHYTVEDMSDLNHICSVLKQNGFYTNYTCGGHIHIGADYLETIDELKMLIHLYCNFEDILYLICNKAYSIPRPSISRYASKTRNKYAKAVNNGIFNGEYACLYDFQQMLIELNKNRYKGLNLTNLRKSEKNTIEFRMANGEMDFEELRHNIKLYARLVQVSKELAHPETTYKTEYLKLLNQPMRDIDRLNILLELLFTNEKDKEFYKNRYKKNLKSLKNIITEIIPTINYVEVVNPVTLGLKK